MLKNSLSKLQQTKFFPASTKSSGTKGQNLRVQPMGGARKKNPRTHPRRRHPTKKSLRNIPPPPRTLVKLGRNGRSKSIEQPPPPPSIKLRDLLNASKARFNLSRRKMP